MEAVCSFETLVDTKRTTRLHIPEDRTLQISPPFTGFNIVFRANCKVLPLRRPDFQTHLSMNGYVLDINTSMVLLVAHYIIVPVGKGSLITVMSSLNNALSDQLKYVLVTRPM
jgi:hypothetical protein